MKKIFVVLAMAAMMFSAANIDAQVKSVNAVRSAVENAQKAASDAKKAAKTATWLKLGETLVEAYNAPMGSGWIGATEQELALVMTGMKPSSEEQVTINGEPMVKKVYDTMNYYFNAQGQLSIIEVTKPVYEDALDQALEAYKKASELDVKGQKTKDIVAAVNSIVEKNNNAAYNEYSFGNLAKATTYFKKAFEASTSMAGVNPDFDALSNAAFTASGSGDLATAKECLAKCLANGYEGEDGDIFARLADVETKLGNAEAGKEILENAFTKYPQSQGILVGLINYYMTSGENTDRLFSLIDDAKANDPANASLLYVEGQTHEKLGEIDAAFKSYEDCIAVDPSYAYGYIGQGVLYSKKADEIIDAASLEMDQRKYEALVEEYAKCLKSSVEPFEKAYELVNDEGTKQGIAQYIKDVCFRLRNESADWQAKYEKYAEIVANNNQ